MKKKGQVAIFIIIGILIVSAVLIFFLWARPIYTGGEDVRIGFEGCVKDALEEGIGRIEKKAGFLDNDFSYNYEGEEVSYLCYTNEFYDTCTVQVPFLKNVFDENLELFLRDRLNSCYGSSLENLKKQGYDVVGGNVEYNVEIEPGVVRVEIEAPTSVESKRLARFNVELNSPVYDMVMIATSILSFESEFGDSDVSEFNLFYPDYYVEKVKRGEGTTVYVIEHKAQGNRFLFASRSLVWPAGYVVE